MIAERVENFTMHDALGHAVLVRDWLAWVGKHGGPGEFGKRSLTIRGPLMESCIPPPRTSGFRVGMSFRTEPVLLFSNPSDILITAT